MVYIVHCSYFRSRCPCGLLVPVTQDFVRGVGELWPGASTLTSGLWWNSLPGVSARELVPPLGCRHDKQVQASRWLKVQINRVCIYHGDPLNLKDDQRGQEQGKDGKVRMKAKDDGITRLIILMCICRINDCDELDYQILTMNGRSFSYRCRISNTCVLAQSLIFTHRSCFPIIGSSTPDPPSHGNPCRNHCAVDMWVLQTSAANV